MIDGEEKKEEENIEIFSIITLGESGVGKTSILKRFIYSVYEEDNASTIGLNFAFKIITLKNNKKVKIKVIDTAGQEKYRSLAKSYIKNAQAVLYVFSIDQKDSLEKIKGWINMFRESKNNPNIPCYLIRNKSDLMGQFDEESINDLMNDNHISGFISVSAKENVNIDKIFEDISELWYKKYRKLQKLRKNITVLN